MSGKSLQHVLTGKTQAHYFHPLGTASRRQVLLPGSFNPLHAGHQAMADIAAQKLGQPVEFELAAVNVDKQPLDAAELSARLKQFPQHGVHVTRAARFVEKARLFPSAIFIVGADTIIRVADLRYYNNDVGAQNAAMEEIAALGCRFMVFGRVVNANFTELPMLPLPPRLAAICTGIGRKEFRLDISSTSLRDSDQASRRAE